MTVSNATFDEIVRLGLKLMRRIGLSLDEQARAMGIAASMRTDDDLLAAVLAMNHRDAMTRFTQIYYIAMMLTSAFGEKYDELARWSRVKHTQYGGVSLLELITSGTIEDLKRAAALAAESAGYPPDDR